MGVSMEWKKLCAIMASVIALGTFGYQAVGVTVLTPGSIQATQFETKTTGGTEGSVYNIYANGYIANNVNFASSGSYTFKIAAYGTAASGVRPKMELRVDGKAIANFSVASVMTTYSATASITGGLHQIAIAFTNDARTVSEDRNLFVSNLSVASSSGLSSALFSISATQMAIKTTGAAEGSLYNLWANGYLANNVNFPTSGNYLFEVAALGTVAAGVFPIMEIRVDGRAITSISVNSTTLKTYAATASVAAGSHQVAIAFVNDLYSPPEDRNLNLSSLKISSTSAPAPAPEPAPAPVPAPIPAPAPEPAPAPTPTPEPAPAPAPSLPTARNVFIQPFASDSIWNHPIGVGSGSIVAKGTGAHSGAMYGYSGGGGALYEKPSSAPLTSVYNDENQNMFAPDAAQKPVYSNTIAWNANPSTNQVRCDAPQTLTNRTEPIPARANYINNPGLYANSCTSILQADRRTIHHTQPGVVCGVGGIFTSQYWSWQANDIFGDGIAGSHGGSGLSELGDVIRWFDLRPPQGGGNHPFIKPDASGKGVADVMRHALGLNVGGLVQNWASQKYWPATNNDGAREGLFLALLPTFDHNSLSTPIGRSVAWTLKNYGGYIVDQTSQGAMSLMGEWSYGPNTPNVLNFPEGRMETTTKADWGYSFSTTTWGSASSSSLGADMVTIWNNLYVVTNNTASTIGGDTSGGATMMQKFLPNPIDPGVLTAVPTFAAQTFSVNRGATADGAVIGAVQAGNWPYFWSLSGADANLFNIDKWGVIRVAYGQTIPSSQTSYTLTVTGTNIVGKGSGTITINVK